MAPVTPQADLKVRLYDPCSRRTSGHAPGGPEGPPLRPVPQADL